MLAELKDMSVGGGLGLGTSVVGLVTALYVFVYTYVPPKRKQNAEPVPVSQVVELSPAVLSRVVQLEESVLEIPALRKDIDKLIESDIFKRDNIARVHVRLDDLLALVGQNQQDMYKALLQVQSNSFKGRVDGT